MTKELFVDEIIKKIKEKLGDEYHITAHNILKNNDLVFHGIVIHKKGCNLAPTIYMDHFYESYIAGMLFDTVVDSVLKIYEKEVPACDVNMEFFGTFSLVKDRICFKVINRELNHQMLKDVPHIPLLDLAVCFYYSYVDEILGEGCILIKKSHMNLWGCDVETLYEAAKENTPRLFPVEITSMQDFIKELVVKKQAIDIPDFFSQNDHDILEDDIGMKILTCRNKIYGAACILYDGIPEKIFELYQSDYYILPSSIHEVILLPQYDDTNPQYLKNMIAEVNRTQLELHEILSDNLYLYDSKTAQIRIV